ncbi:UTP--glucose-1-phosphate uridylyltransferase [Brucepastera parasyntrophica]|uniref:UTP--glucose-1-phosphate uridylyltransferase n=1 Tax=Brucepastera parasyntrophica TaxID=2880008 RepID=UPI00210C62DA|nr:UTP--glucose-1-phosphate uridylyltransferase [Brucepastera parasyntrophica]ULQ60936.1 UTP--glucose-1-phosphate uridylyltransferase [Brucepastera parasyntrophica]
MKGIIVAAGYGTRFLPVTKTIPKEMLPLISVPSIQFIVDEFVSSGISDIIIITSRRKKALEDYFDRELELEQIFRNEGKTRQLELISPQNANIAFIRQQKMMGTGHALLQAKNWLGDEPCVVAYPDDLHFGEVPLASQLIAVYQKTGCSVMASITEPGDVSRYGVLDLDGDGMHVRGIVEKPSQGTEPGHDVSIGRYLYTPDFFALLEEGWEIHLEDAKKNNTEPGEYFHIYALNRLMEQGRVANCSLEGTRLDTGDPAGYLEAVLRYADSIPEYRVIIDSFLKNRNSP